MYSRNLFQSTYNLNTITITPKSEDKYVEKVFNSTELHFSEVTSFKIGTLVFVDDSDFAHMKSDFFENGSHKSKTYRLCNNYKIGPILPIEFPNENFNFRSRWCLSGSCWH